MKKVTSNVVADGHLIHKFVPAETCFTLADVVAGLVTVVAAVEVPEMLVVLVEVVKDDVETMAACTTSDEEFWAFEYELPSPRT